MSKGQKNMTCEAYEFPDCACDTCEEQNTHIAIIDRLIGEGKIELDGKEFKHDGTLKNSNGHDAFCLCDGCMRLTADFKSNMRGNNGKPIWAGMARECGYPVNY